MNLTKAKETKTRVCCLYRVSTKGQVDKAENDIPMQKKACHEFAESKGWTIIKEHAELGVCALPGFVDSKNEEKTERNAGYLVVSFCFFFIFTVHETGKGTMLI